LYYPYHPENGEWLRHALLYYDYIGTTVPSLLEGMRDECRLPGYLYGLRETGQYRALVDEVGLRNVADQLGQIDDAFAFARVPRAEDVALNVFLDPAFIAHDNLRGKSFQLVDLLAGTVAGLANDVVVPATDRPRSFQHLFGDQAATKNASLTRGLYITYSELLPTPRADVSLNDVIQFKKRRADELQRMRSELAKLRVALGGATSRDELRALVADAERGIEVSVADLQRAMRADRLTSVSGLVREVVEMKSPWLASLIASVAAAGATAKDLNSIPLSALVAGVAVGASVAIGTGLISVMKQGEKLVQGAPYGYLQLARDAGILPGNGREPIQVVET
jgi:hypothetical protein